MTNASSLVIPMLNSLLVTPTILLTHQPLLLPANLMTKLAINFALVNDVTPDWHGFIINAVSAKTTQSNGLNAKCTIQPLGLKRPMILMQCAKIHSLQDIMLIICPPSVVSSYHADNPCWSSKCSHLLSCSCSCSQSFDHHDNDRHSYQSSCPCIDNNYITHNNLPSSTSVNSVPHSDSPDNMIWNTNPDTNHYHPVHFDGPGKHETLSLPPIALHLIWMMIQMSHLNVEKKQPQVSLLPLMSATIQMSHLTVGKKQPQVRLLPLMSATILIPKQRNTTTGIPPNQLHSPQQG